MKEEIKKTIEKQEEIKKAIKKQEELKRRVLSMQITISVAFLVIIVWLYFMPSYLQFLCIPAGLAAGVWIKLGTDSFLEYRKEKRDVKKILEGQNDIRI